MNPAELLRLVDAIHRDKHIDKEIVFQGIESALLSAARRHYGEIEEIVVTIDRETGMISGHHGEEELDPEVIGRIGAQTAKQVMIQKIREAERDTLFDEYIGLQGQLINGTVTRFEGGKAIVSLGPKLEALLPRREQIPHESFHPGDRVKATIAEVRKAGSRVQIILSRTRNDLVQRLFEQEIPEIAEGVIQIKSIAREVGYRSKLAVHSVDQRVDCVGACVGVRGNRIKNIVDELGGERIDIVRWNDSLQPLIANALQPAEVEESILCQMLGRAIVLVREDQLSLAIGRKGQNVRLASKLVGWDIEVMTRDELDEQIEQAITGYCEIDGVDQALSEQLVGEGFLSYDDLSIIEPEDLMEMGELTEEQVNAIVEDAEERAEEAERAAIEARRKRREESQSQQLTPQAAATSEASVASEEGDSGAGSSDSADSSAAE
ncbi:Transcription termination protein NusA [Planctomycetales bacterium 10988]|nr:Transcription termination protein NusA [Planctomycetales bacterium 10988]